MSDQCKDCVQAAIHWAWCGFTASCRQCNVRGLAASPKFIREHHYEMVLRRDGAETLDKAKKEISVEYGRMQRLKWQKNELQKSKET